MAMSTKERARKAAAARWAKATPEERAEAARKMAQGRTPESELRRLRTMAANAGYRLVPIEEDTQGERSTA